MTFNGNEFLQELSRVGYVPKKKVGRISKSQTLISTTDYAERTGLSVTRIRRMFKKGLLFGIRDGRFILIDWRKSDETLSKLTEQNVSVDTLVKSLKPQRKNQQKNNQRNRRIVDDDIAEKKRLLKAEANMKS